MYEARVIGVDMPKSFEEVLTGDVQEVKDED